MSTCKIVALVLFGLTAAYASEHTQQKRESFLERPITVDTRPKFVLFSWRDSAGSDHFALVRNADGMADHRFIDKFNIKHTRGLDLNQLEREMRKLPDGCLVVWMEDEPHKLGYADEKAVRRIKSLATRLRLDLRLSRMRYE